MEELDIIQISKSYPLSAWHHQIYRNDLGLVFFKIDGEEGPFKIQVQLLEYETDEISTIIEFSFGTEEDVVYHVYMFEKMENSCISCETIDDLRTILKNHYVCIWMYNDRNYKRDKIQIVKLDQPDQILYEISSRGLYEYCQPVLLDIGLNDIVSFKN